MQMSQPRERPDSLKESRNQQLEGLKNSSEGLRAWGVQNAKDGLQSASLTEKMRTMNGGNDQKILRANLGKLVNTPQFQQACARAWIEGPVNQHVFGGKGAELQAKALAEFSKANPSLMQQLRTMPNAVPNMASAQPNRAPDMPNRTPAHNIDAARAYVGRPSVEPRQAYAFNQRGNDVNPAETGIQGRDF